MEIRDNQGNILTNPDLTLGHLVPKVTKILHGAIQGSPAETKEIVVWKDPDNPNNKIVKQIEVKPAIKAVPAYTEEKKYYEYVLFTPEELAEKEEQKKQEEQMRLEQEEINKKQQILREQLAGMPSRMEHTESQVEDLAVVLVEIIEGV